MSCTLRPIFAFSLIWTLASPGGADLRLERVRTIETPNEAGEMEVSQERAETVLIGDGAARIDFRSGSAIVRLDDNVYVWLDHQAKAYAEASLPLTLESFLTDQEKQCLQHVSGGLRNVEATVTLTEERRVIGRWEARKYRVEGRHPVGFRLERDEWITESLSVDLAPYHQVLLSRGALSPAIRGWIAEAVALGGYSVESTVERRSSRGSLVISKQRLVSVEEVPADASRFRPPPDYAPTLSRPPLDVACGPPTARPGG